MRLECVVLYNESQIVVVISSFVAYASGEKRLAASAKVPNVHRPKQSGMLRKRLETETSDWKSRRDRISHKCLILPRMLLGWPVMTFV